MSIELNKRASREARENYKISKIKSELRGSSIDQRFLDTLD